MLQVEELFMVQRNRVPISHEFNFSHKSLQLLLSSKACAEI